MDFTQDPQPLLNATTCDPISAVKSEPLQGNISLISAASPKSIMAEPTERTSFVTSTSHTTKDPVIKAEPETEVVDSPLAAAQRVPSSQQMLQLQQETNIETKEEEAQDTNYLQQLLAQETPDILEVGVKIGTSLLDDLNATLTLDDLDAYPNVKAWKKSIDELKEQAKPTKAIVGVVGNTGAGKSSVINALLDEERLLPTNCLRACTASPTEISYNYSDKPKELYRAEIEFISGQDWGQELKVLFSDLLDGNGEVSRDCTNSDSEAGVAYAKLKAVYPNKTKEMLARGTPRGFADEPAVRAVLGSVRKLEAESAPALYRQLQHFVDSKEKVLGENNRRGLPMEYWPLIKVVRIFTKANALSTGAVIVDLPGVQDSNAARAAVAANYMKSCTGLWIVAPINRAVDDKTAKSLLGDSFKRQLKYDGTYSAVTFICSKTDDISITEASESLNMEEEISESWNRAEELKDAKSELKKKLIDLKGVKAAYTEELDECEAKVDIWEDLQSRKFEGETVYEPLNKPDTKKRKRLAKPAGSRKNLASSDFDDSSDDSDSDLSDKENFQPFENRITLTEENIEETLASLKSQKKKIREERRSLDGEITKIRKQMEEHQKERDLLLAEVKAACVKGRNEYSRGAIKQDFAMGIKELDQENAVEEDDTTFDPDQDLRDYDEVARTLPVFCVSSRAYQHMSGRLLKDDFHTLGFISPEDTEVPQLQEHAKKLTEVGRASSCRRFLNGVSQLVNSMKLWASNDGRNSCLSDAEKRREQLFLQKLLDELEKGFEKTVAESISSVKDSLNEHVFQTFNVTVPQAINTAVATASSWGAHRSMGGLFWATYKATVRRNGVYSGASGPRDFNSELFDPISRNLATGWERTFQRRLPAHLDLFAANSKKLLQQFHQSAVERAEKRHTNVTGVLTLSHQILAHIRTLGELPSILRAMITDLQRDASREFVPVIMDAMTHAYNVCTEERGSGSYARMKTAMVGHVDATKHTMFRQACDKVKAQLERMCREVQRQMSDRTETIFDAVFRDYMAVLAGTTVDRHAKIPPQERAMRTKVNDILRHADARFAGALHVEGPSEPEQDIVEKIDDFIEEPGLSGPQAKKEDAAKSAMDTSVYAQSENFQEETRTNDNMLVPEQPEDRHHKGSKRLKQEDDFPDIFDLIERAEKA